MRNWDVCTRSIITHRLQCQLGFDESSQVVSVPDARNDLLNVGSVDKLVEEGVIRGVDDDDGIVRVHHQEIVISHWCKGVTTSQPHFLHVTHGERDLRFNHSLPMTDNKRVREDDADVVEVAPPTKKPRLDGSGRVLLFLDLGDRKGLEVAPKLFGEITEKKWNVVDVQLDEPDWESVNLQFGDIECPVERADVKVALKERDDPEAYKRMRDLFTDTLKQELGNIHFVFS